MAHRLSGRKRPPLALAGAALALGLATSGAADAQSLEYVVKANYLSKFGPFVEWPPGAFESPTSPFNICVLGDAPFGGSLEQATRGQRVRERTVAVHKLRTVAAETNCHVLYLGRSNEQPASEALRRLEGRPVLTVTDASQGAAGGVVHFVLDRGRVRFAIDAAAARARGLAISSKLLELAVNAGQGGG